MNAKRVAVWQAALKLGEGGQADIGRPTDAQGARVAEAIAGCFALAGLDNERKNSDHWNPLGDFIHPGDKVVLKPNLITEAHPHDPNGWQYTMTDPRVIWAVMHWACKALAGRGSVALADAPQTDASFERIRRLCQLDSLLDSCRLPGLDLAVVDLRREEWVSRDSVIVERKRLPGDPNGYVAFDLAGKSAFAEHDGAGRYYGADYDAGAVNRHHSGGCHEYLVSRTVIEADVIISLPKLKTHKKAGITVSLKNLVGINGDKNWLPHHTEAGFWGGGDERPRPSAKDRMERAAVRHLRHLSLLAPGVGTWIHRHARRAGNRVFGDTEDVIRSGNWWGNDTVWRMCLDLNKILLYGNPDGTLRAPSPKNRKRHLVVVDGIVAGQGRGPLNPDPFPAGIVAFGTNPASVDAACAVLMGFDPDKIPIIRQAFRCSDYPIAGWEWHDVRLVSNKPEWNGLLPDIAYESTFHFKPHFGWKGHIERTEPSQHPIGTGPSQLSDADKR